MCGICGIWSKQSKLAVPNMVAAMQHRGPDDNGVHYDERAALGMARLAIMDTSNAGHQPMSASNGDVWLVYNGEIYNYKEQRKLLEGDGHNFQSDSDTEVVLKLYLKYGDHFLKYMQGMFAVAILDKRNGPGKERLLLARDPMGIKPLLYAGNQDRLIFASELKSILASGEIPREINPNALHGLLAQGSIAQPDTIIRGVKMLLPGHKLTVENNKVEIERYWQLSTTRNAQFAKAPYAEQVSQLRKLLENAIEKHMVSDVPIGAFLSGGVDSTILVGLMSRLNNSAIRTFSVGFGDEGNQLDEADIAFKTASYFGTQHTKVMVSANDVRDRLSHIATALDQPSVDGANSYFVSAAAASSVKVAISGTGGDESFAGYPWFQSMAELAPNITGNGLPMIRRLMSNLIAPHLRKSRHPLVTGILSKIRAQGDFLETFSRQYRIFGTANAYSLLSHEMANKSDETHDDRFRAELADFLPEADTISRSSALCMRGYLQNQLLRDIDAVSMAHSLEVRVPFLDTNIIDFALSLPDTTKLGGPSAQHAWYPANNAKRILVDATRDLFPTDYQSHEKRGFSMPYDVWLKGPLRDILEESTSFSKVANRGLFNPEKVKNVRQSFIAGSTNWSLPWLLMITELWCQSVLDNSTI